MKISDFFHCLCYTLPMFRIWIKEFKDNHLLKDITIEDVTDDTRTHKVFNALEKGCYELDIPQPIWLDSNIRDFKKYARTRFTKDSFIEEVDFDYLDFHIIEE